MSTFGIMRVEKRNRHSVYGLQIEANRTKRDHDIHGREFDRSDIDWDMTEENIFLVKTDRWNKKITDIIHAADVKERRDSVVMLDALYTASHEWFELHPDRTEQLQFFRDCLAFHIREFCQNDSSLVINAVVHLDETTPHLQIASVPIIRDEKGAHLSAKLVMGSRSDYKIRQDRFYKHVSSIYGMERGEIKAPAETKAHTTKREWQIAVLDEEIAKRNQDIIIKRSLQEQLDNEAKQADMERMEALRSRDRVFSDLEVENILQKIQEDLCALKEDFDIQILSQTPEHRTITGKIVPATATISAVDLEYLRNATTLLKNGHAISMRIEKAASDLKQQAENLHRNKIDDQAIAINQYAREASERTAQIKRELSTAKSKLYIADQRLQKVTKDLAELQIKHSKILAVLSFFPTLWNALVERTKKAIHLQMLYISETDLVKKSALLAEYADECQKNSLTGDKAMLEAFKKQKEHNTVIMQ